MVTVWRFCTFLVFCTQTQNVCAFGISNRLRMCFYHCRGPMKYLVWNMGLHIIAPWIMPPSSPPTLHDILPLYIWSLFYFHVFIDLFDAPVGNKCPKMATYMSVGFLPVTTPLKKMSFLSRWTMNCLQTLVNACTLATIICLQVVRSSEASRACLSPWQETYRPITQVSCW